MVRLLGWRFSQPEDAACYVLKRSDLQHYFKLAEHTVNPLKETTREKLVQAGTETASSEPAGDKREAKDDDASAAAERESAAGGEPAEADV